MHGTLTFTRPTDVVADEERAGLLRALPVREDDPGDVQPCEFRDLSAADTVEPGLDNAGFETVDVTKNLALQAALNDVRTMDQLTDSVASAIRASLDGAEFGLSDGTSLRIDHVADDGLFHRRAGPNGLEVNPGGIDGINGHSGAQYVHGDQDVYGTPMRQLMHGAAPDMFRHVTPDGRNDDAPALLINLWIPLHAPVQPLALMDRRTLDAARHQLRYGLPVDDFLDRDDEESVNDIWHFLHDPGQQWYVRTDMGSGQGYVFNTLGTAHGAAVLAGEDALEEAYLVLHRMCDAIDRGDDDELQLISSAPLALQPPAHATPTIRNAWQHMAELQETAGEGDTVEWRRDARAAIDNVIRRSIEIRLVATLIDA